MVNGPANGMVTRPVRRMTQGELDNFLEGAADILRGNVDHSEFRGYVFALLFYKRINDVYEENVRLYARKLGGEEASARDPKMHEFVVPNDCQWEKVARLFPRPHPDEQQEMVDILESSEVLIDAASSVVDAVKRLKKSLLQNLLTGKVRVKMEAVA